MSKETITKEIDIYYCDICGNESKNIIQCPICKKDVCQYCRAWNQCIKCWNENNTFATIKSKIDTDDGYGGRTYTSYTLKFDSNKKWDDLLKRFNRKHVKITFEEVKDYETIKKEKRLKELEGDDPKEFLERCG